MIEEVTTKLARLADFLDRHRLDGVLLWQRDHFAWITGGCDNRIPDSSPVGVAAIYATRGEIVCLANSIEAPRMRGEELAQLEVPVVEIPWWDRPAAAKIARGLFGDSKVATDVDVLGLGLPPLPDGFTALRYSLLPQEIERYRQGAARTAGAIEKTCARIEPGMNEFEISARLARDVRAAGVLPVVNLVAADDRISRFRHPIPTAKRLEKYVMLVVCGSFGGLISNLTRFVHFGPPSDELKRKQQAIANIDATVNLATKPKRKLSDVFDELQRAYEREGHADQWKLHHQGGPTGYAGRETLGTPTSDFVVRDDQPFAWNPSIVGIKSEDTVLVRADGIEVLTKHSDDFPSVVGTCDHGELRRAGVLVR